MKNLKVFELANKYGQCLARVQATSPDEAAKLVSSGILDQTFRIDEVLQ